MTIIGLQKDIIQNRILCYDCDGFKIPATKSYFPLSETATKIMEGINNKTGKDIVKKNIEAKIEYTVKHEDMDKFIQEYQEKQNSVLFGEDEMLEKLVPDIMKSQISP